MGRGECAVQYAVDIYFNSASHRAAGHRHMHPGIKRYHCRRLKRGIYPRGTITHEHHHMSIGQHPHMPVVNDLTHLIRDKHTAPSSISRLGTPRTLVEPKFDGTIS